jgi:hypothetical protein
MEKEIITTADIPEDELSEDSDFAATTESDPQEKIEFFVQMRGYTQSDMDALIVEAAARIIVGKHGDTTLAKEIQERCIELTAQKADDALNRVTKEIMDQPMTPQYGDKKPVTMRGFLELYGREYLSAKVDRDGKPSQNQYGSQPRMEYLVAKAMDSKFKQEIADAASAVIREVQAEIKARHAKLLDDEKAKIRHAIEQVTR